MARKLILLTEGFSEPRRGKTACNMIRYRPDEVACVLDSTNAGKTAKEILGVGDAVPVVASLDEAVGMNDGEAVGATELLIGIAPPGGRIPPAWRSIVLEALRRGLDVVSGLHEFLGDDPEFAAAAKTSGATISDLRKSNERDVAKRQGLREDGLRILTVGHDCNVGKMVAALEIAEELKRRGEDAAFLATGQTGILLEGDGVPVDAVGADFIAGSIERLILRKQDRRILLVEGQGSLVHPSYSGVTLGLLHGSAPHGLILVYEAGRPHVWGFPELPMPPLTKFRELNESLAGVFAPCPVIGVAMNGRYLSEREAEIEKARASDELQLPVSDVLRDGPGMLADVVQAFDRVRAFKAASRKLTPEARSSSSDGAFDPSAT